MSRERAALSPAEFELIRSGNDRLPEMTFSFSLQHVSQSGRRSRFAGRGFDLAGECEMVLNKPSRDGGPERGGGFALLAHVYSQQFTMI